MSRLCFFLLYFFLLFSGSPTAAPMPIDELTSGYMTIVDEKGSTVLQTGLIVHPGDQYISEENRMYEVASVEGNLAVARYIRNESLLYPQPAVLPVQAVNGTSARIAIYHTHTDESYIPTDGEASTPGKGSIMTVGDAFASRLNNLGFQTEHDKTLHEPHDANAYQRSRRTFMKLLNNQPQALFDVHRDSAPLSIYKATINGQDVAKILLVVGRQNQNRAVTMDYARGIKGSVDAKYKGLIRGIFIARGNYNQDLNPRSMLIEIGTQYNTLDAAQRSITLFADTVPTFINAGTSGSVASAAEGSYYPPPFRYLTDILSILGVLMVGTAAYLYLSTGSWQEMKNKLRNFRNYEFTNFFGSYKRRKK